MKQLTLLAHNGAQQELADQLRALRQVSAFTFTHVEGHGQHLDNDPRLSARDKVVGYTPRVRIDILLDEGDVESVLDTLRQTAYGISGHCTYWLTAIEQSGKL